jgi:hypothetical protein
VAVLLALCALPLRGDLNNPPGRAWVRFIRDATAEMRHVIPAGSKVVIIPCWNGSPFGHIVRYDLWQPSVAEQGIQGTILWETAEEGKESDGPDPKLVASLAMRGEANYLIIQDGECEWDAEDTSELGLSPIKHEFALFAWRKDAWEKVKSWPIPPALIYRD